MDVHGAGARGAGARGARARESGTQARGTARRGERAALRHDAKAPATRRWADHARAACACWLGQIGCLVHLTHFDSVFGLSTVPESLIGH